MQLSTIIASVLVSAASISAAPTAQIAKREAGGIKSLKRVNADPSFKQVLICQGANATGNCHYEVYTMQECHDLPTDLQRNASTFAPDGDNFYCYPRAGNCSQICTSPTGCTFGAVSFDSPVKYDLSSIQWDNLIGAFSCHLNETST
ncbi:hypothetical protein G7054_g7754 [Neopestalotiopsis clavispora]|nr:hypothetical protein G7054_g7754 [Neopestalotiopsis clavispora]